MDMRQGLLIGLLAALCYARSARAGGSAEVMAGDENAVVDIKTSGDLGHRVGIFARNRTRIDYHNQVSPFTLVDLTYSLGEGFDAVAEAQMAPGMGIVPRAGAQYFHSFGDGSVYVFASGSHQDPNLELLATVRYTPAIAGDVKGFAQLEALTDLGQDGHEFSTQRARLGIEIGGYRIGAGADLVEIGHDATPSYNIGGFVAKNF